MTLENPDISQISMMKIKERNFPLKQEYRITISNSAFDMISNHASENSTVEICGVLIGDVFKDSDGPFLEITDIIKGEYADNQAGEVKFTHETWSHINSTKDAEFKDKQIVGWYHSHPHFGIFLSDQDMFIHQNFFNQSWQVAFVIDPISNDDGFFVWQNGKAIKSQQIWIDGTKVEKSKVNNDSQVKLIENIGNKIESVSKQLRKVVKPYQYVIGLLVFAALLALNYALLNENFNNLLYPLKQSIINEQFQNTDDIKKLLSQNQLLSELSINIIKKGDYIWCSGEVYTLHQKELIAKIIGSIKNIASVDLQGVVATYSYNVLPDETLGKVSQKIYGYTERWKDIYETNKEIIKDPNKILPYTKIILPE